MFRTISVNLFTLQNVAARLVVKSLRNFWNALSFYQKRNSNKLNIILANLYSCVHVQLFIQVVSIWRYLNIEAITLRFRFCILNDSGETRKIFIAGQFWMRFPK